DERGPEPRSRKYKKQQPGDAQLPIRGDKTIEIGEVLVKPVAHALDALERNPSHRGQPRNRSRLHIDQSSAVLGHQAALFGGGSDARTCYQPGIGTTCARRSISLAGLNIYYASRSIGLSGFKVRAQRARPACGYNHVELSALLPGIACVFELSTAGRDPFNFAERLCSG